MADEAPTTEAPVTEPNTPAAPDEADEPRIPRARLNQEAEKRKAAERELAELRGRMEQLEAAGLSETEQERKARERAEKRAEDAEQRATKMEAEAARVRAENWIGAAASTAGFEDAEDAVLRINASEIESAEDAERAVKRLAREKPRLLKTDEPVLPGQVLENGRQPAPKNGQQPRGAIDPNAEAEGLANALKQFANNWHTVGE